ncbi:unnamed protein product, partial [Rotaria magnacalcarata]
MADKKDENRRPPSVVNFLNEFQRLFKSRELKQIA